MKQLKHIFFFILITLLTACGDTGSVTASNSGGISGTGDGSSKSGIAGRVYKGPMIQGSVLKLFPIINGIVSQQFIETRVLSDKGDFALSVNNGLYLIQADGTYFDENIAGNTRDNVQLKAIADIQSDGKVFINVLTHITSNYTLSLIQAGNDYATASQKAKSRTLALLKPITGEVDITSDFNQIGLTEEDNNNTTDINYAAYLSALITKTSSDNANLSVQSLLTELESDVSNTQDIDDLTLEKLLKSHGNIDAPAVTTNLGTVLSPSTAADIRTISSEIDEFNPALAAPTYALVNAGSAYNFYFDGSFENNGGIAGRALLSGGHYEVQISKDEFFSLIEDTNPSPLPSNFYQTVASNLVGPGKRYVRVRKVKNNGQLGQWSAVLEFTI